MKETEEKILFPKGKIASRLTIPEGDARARKVVKRSNYGHVVKFPSVKCNRIIEAESLLEYDRVILLEMDSNVASFQEQPFMLEYEDDGVIKKIYPDFLVIRRDGTKTVEEVKPSYKAKLPKFLRRIALEEKALAQHGYSFELQTENEIRREPRLANAKNLLPCRRNKVNPLTKKSVTRHLKNGPLTWAELISQIPELSHEELKNLVAHGVVSCDLTIPHGVASTYETIKGGAQ